MPHFQSISLADSERKSANMSVGTTSWPVVAIIH